MFYGIFKCTVTAAAMSSGGLLGCVRITHAELTARLNVEHAIYPAIAYEPSLGAELWLFILHTFRFFRQILSQVIRSHIQI